jgi:Lrp/AsnC family leucine-responsive transcriptional regulator
MSERESHSVDEIGWKILDELQKNGRASFKQLAEIVGLSPTAVIERVKRMEDEGIITGYSAVINPRRVGYSLSAIISLSANPGSEQIINESLSRIPEVLSCWSLTGTNDFMLEIQVPSLEFLEELLSELSRYGKLMTSIVLPSSEKRRIISPPRVSMTD